MVLVGFALPILDNKVPQDFVHGVAYESLLTIRRELAHSAVMANGAHEGIWKLFLTDDSIDANKH